MSDTRPERGGVLKQLKGWLRPFVGDDEREARADGGVDPERVETNAAGATGERRADYHEEASRLLAEGREKEADILELVGERGGTTPQKDLVAAIAYSEASVSRRLQMMERTGLVVRLTRGREKIVCLPDMVPDELRD
jgi:hypothetical protein